jgi:hypothetical protein
MPPENSDVFSGQSTMWVWNEFITSLGLSVPPPSGIEVMVDASICHTCAQVEYDLLQKKKKTRSVRRKISGVSIHSSYLGLQSVACTSLKASGYYDYHLL